jgi:hypothetical protein
MCIFVIPLAITAVRVQYREHMARIEALERTLDERCADEAYLKVAIERACDYAAVQKEAQGRWKMKVAGQGQRFLFAPEAPIQVATLAEGGAEDGSVAHRAGRFLRGDAQARSAMDERTVRAR